MATSAVSAIPAGTHSVARRLICAAAAAIDFYEKAFGATEKSRLPGSDGKLMHGAIAMGGPHSGSPAEFQKYTGQSTGYQLIGQRVRFE